MKQLVAILSLLLYIDVSYAQRTTVVIDNVVYYLYSEYDWDKDEYVKHVEVRWNAVYDTQYSGYPAVDINIKPEVSFPGDDNKYPVLGIEAYGFKGCNIKSITIPNSITTIKYGAFEDCRFLSQELTIPSSVTTIQQRAFKNCKMLCSFNCEATTPPRVRYYSGIGPYEEWTSAFDGFDFHTVEGRIGGGPYLHVPKGCWEAYTNPTDKNALDWKNFEIIYDDLSSGVNEIHSDDLESPAVYYNLQGLRVDNPIQGNLYIMKQGRITSKVIYYSH